jgi:hypothetical protein
MLAMVYSGFRSLSPAGLLIKSVELGEDRIPIATSGDFLSSGHHDISGHCWRCRWHPKLPLADLAARYGRDLAITDLRLRLRCSSCGSPGELTISNAGMGAVTQYRAD